MIYDTVDKIYSKISEYARRPEGGVHRLLLIHAPKEHFQKIADLAPEGDEELKRILSENGIHLRDWEGIVLSQNYIYQSILI